MKQILFFLIIATLFTNLAAADYVFLKDGSQMKGTILQIKESSIVIQTEYGTATIPKSKIINTIYGESLNNSPDISPVQHKTQKSEDSDSASTGRTEPESWYMSVALGGGAMAFNNDLKKHVNQYSSISSSEMDQRPFGFFNYGFYLTMNSQLILGPSFSVFASRWDEDVYLTGNYYKNKYSVNGFLLHLDFKLFFNEICSGFYLNLAPGIGMISFQRNNGSKEFYSSESASKLDHNTEAAMGGKAGFGWAFELKRFDRALTLEIEGFYIKGTYRNDQLLTKEKWAVAGVMASIGLLW